MIEIVDATYRHLYAVADRLCDEDLRELSCTRDTEDTGRLAHDALDSCYRKIAITDGQPVMAFGARRFPTMLDPSVAFVWGFKTRLDKRVMRAVTKHILKVMIPTLRADGIDKAACFVHTGNAVSCRWLAHLGFAPKATLSGTGTPHKDLILYLRDDAHA